MDFTVKITDTLEDGGRYVRTAVFIEEQGFQQEYDEIDKTAQHIQVFDGDRAIGAGRLFPEEDDVWHIGRIAVLPEYRKLHIGALIMNALEQRARECGGRQAILSAQCRAAGFYEKCGYVQQGDVYPDEGCPHILMTKTL